MLRTLVLTTAGFSAVLGGCGTGAPTDASDAGTTPVALPSPMAAGDRSLEEALSQRRSIREYAGERVDPAAIAQLLWSAQGVTTPDGRRTAPSAGALYPLELYLVDEGGIHRYVPADHALETATAGDRREDVAEVVGQDAVRAAPILFVITGTESRTAERYGDRAERYVWLEAGHAAQNLLLQATALGLGAVPMGSFDDAALTDLLELPDGETPLYVIPVGHPAR